LLTLDDLLSVNSGPAAWVEDIAPFAELSGSVYASIFDGFCPASLFGLEIGLLSAITVGVADKSFCLETCVG
jgi:hypothetical protein